MCDDILKLSQKKIVLPSGFHQLKLHGVDTILMDLEAQYTNEDVQQFIRIAKLMLVKTPLYQLGGYSGEQDIENKLAQALNLLEKELKAIKKGC